MLCSSIPDHVTKTFFVLYRLTTLSNNPKTPRDQWLYKLYMLYKTAAFRELRSVNTEHTFDNDDQVMVFKERFFIFYHSVKLCRFFEIAPKKKQGRDHLFVSTSRQVMSVDWECGHRSWTTGGGDGAHVRSITAKTKAFSVRGVSLQHQSFSIRSSQSCDYL